MSRRRRIRVAALVALLVAWPIVVEWVKRESPSEAGVHGLLAVVSLLIYVAIAAVLRSGVVAGLLGGVLAWAITNPFPDMRDPDYVPQWWGRLFLWSVIGFFVGIGWEGLHSFNFLDGPKLPSPDRFERSNDFSGPQAKGLGPAATRDTIEEVREAADCEPH